MHFLNSEFAPIFISAFALLVSLISTSVLFFLMRTTSRQTSLDAYCRINDINRTLITIGFEDRELLDLLDGHQINDHQKAQRYLQLWLNQIAIIHASRKLCLIDNNLWNSMFCDASEFFELPIMRDHWSQVRQYYDPELQSLLDRMSECKKHNTPK